MQFCLKHLSEYYPSPHSLKPQPHHVCVETGNTYLEPFLYQALYQVLVETIKGFISSLLSPIFLPLPHKKTKTRIKTQQTKQKPLFFTATERQVRQLECIQHTRAHRRTYFYIGLEITMWVFFPSIKSLPLPHPQGKQLFFYIYKIENKHLENDINMTL